MEKCARAKFPTREIDLNTCNDNVELQCILMILLDHAMKCAIAIPSSEVSSAILSKIVTLLTLPCLNTRQ